MINCLFEFASVSIDLDDSTYCGSLESSLKILDYGNNKYFVGVDKFTIMTYLI